jgi:hypothetical protein
MIGLDAGTAVWSIFWPCGCPDNSLMVEEDKGNELEEIHQKKIMLDVLYTTTST